MSCCSEPQGGLLLLHKRGELRATDAWRPAAPTDCRWHAHTICDTLGAAHAPARREASRCALCAPPPPINPRTLACPSCEVPCDAPNNLGYVNIMRGLYNQTAQAFARGFKTCGAELRFRWAPASHLQAVVALPGLAPLGLLLLDVGQRVGVEGLQRLAVAAPLRRHLVAHQLQQALRGGQRREAGAGAGLW